MSRNNRTAQIIIGTLASGALIGTAAYLLTTTKAGKKIQKNVKHKYSEYRDLIEDFIEDLKDNISSNGTAEWSKKASDAAEYFRDQIETLSDPRHSELRYGLLAGAICGGLLGVGAAALLKSRIEDEGSFQEDISRIKKKLGQRATNWKKNLDDVLDILNERMESRREEVHDQFERSPYAHRINQALDLASAGIQFWQGFRKR